MSTEAELDVIFKALANPVRRAICDTLKLTPLTTKRLCMCFINLDRTTVMMHLGVLERGWCGGAEGGERFNPLDAMPSRQSTSVWLGPAGPAACGD